MGHHTDKRLQDKLEFDAIEQEQQHEKDMKEERAERRKEHDKATLLVRHAGQTSFTEGPEMAIWAAVMGCRDPHRLCNFAVSMTVLANRQW